MYGGNQCTKKIGKSSKTLDKAQSDLIKNSIVKVLDWPATLNSNRLS